jgi:hypothetical protein
MSESTALVAALLSAWLASRRKLVLRAWEMRNCWLQKTDLIKYLQAVVRIVNQEYVAIVARVIQAKSTPNLYVFQTT